MVSTAIVAKSELKSASTEELLEFYNRESVHPIKKFESRAVAESRVWKLIQSLPPEEEIKKKTVKKEKVQSSVKTESKEGKRGEYEKRKIALLIDKNPKREGSRAYKKFGILMKYDGQTVGEYRSEEGKHEDLDFEKGWTSTEIRWALKQGWIKISA